MLTTLQETLNKEKRELMDQAPVLVVGIGEIKVGKEPAVIRTNLGSCIGVCLYEKDKRLGGMLHLMLPSANGHDNKPGFRKTKYADTGLPELIGELRRTYGTTEQTLTAKIFGGAKLLKAVTQDIGMDNEKAVREILKNVGIRIIAAKTGGDKGYQIDFNLVTGAVSCRVFGQTAQEM